MSWRHAGAALLLLTGMAAAPLSGQEGRETVDRIAAVIGSAVVLESQVDEELFARLQASGRQPPTDSSVMARLRREMLDTLIDAELLYHEALKDTTIKMNNLELADLVEQELRGFRAEYPSEEAFRADLGNSGYQSLDEFRRARLDAIRRHRVIEQFQTILVERGVLTPKAPTEREVREYYELRSADLPMRPPTISVKQIVIMPKPNFAERERARLLADSIAKEIRGGADFAVAARRFSQDPGSAQRGGDLDWFRRGGNADGSGRMVKEFEDAAFSLSRGTVSEPVESPFGFHIIQVERIQGSEIRARHILIIPQVDSIGAAAARQLAVQLREAVAAGASIDSLQNIYHDPVEERDVRSIPVDSLPQMYADAFRGVEVGQITQVFELPPDRSGWSKWAFARVYDRQPAGPLTLDDLREGIRRMLGEAMARDAYLKQLRQANYVDIRMK